MKNHEKSMKIMKNHEISLKNMKNHKKSMKIIKNHEKSMKIMKNHWKSPFFIKIINFLMKLCIFHFFVNKCWKCQNIVPDWRARCKAPGLLWRPFGGQKSGSQTALPRFQDPLPRFQAPLPRFQTPLPRFGRPSGRSFSRRFLRISSWMTIWCFSSFEYF